MHAMGGVIDIRRFGGLRLLPSRVTFLSAAGIGGRSLSFWSKDDTNRATERRTGDATEFTNLPFRHGALTAFYVRLLPDFLVRSGFRTRASSPHTAARGLAAGVLAACAGRAAFPRDTGLPGSSTVQLASR
jgi:hypothetical protein